MFNVSKESIMIMLACKSDNVNKKIKETIANITGLKIEDINDTCENYWLSLAYNEIGKYDTNIKNTTISDMCNDIDKREFVYNKYYESIYQMTNDYMKYKLMMVICRQNGKDLYPYL